VGREVDGEGIEMEGPAAGRTGDEVVAALKVTGPSLETGRLGLTTHLAATGPTSTRSDAGTRARFGCFGTAASVDFRFEPAGG
jgi:hypothetical protein